MHAAMTPSETQREATHKLLRQVNITLLVGGVLSVPVTIFLAGMPLSFVVLFLILCILVVAIRSWLFSLQLGSFVLGIFCSLVVVWVIALIGFYGPNAEIGGEFRAGRGTYVSDKHVGTAIESSMLFPSTFTSALFGEDCGGDSMTGPNCSVVPVYLALTFDYAVLAIGVVFGNLLVKRLSERN
jgi:hypothetical protein